MSLNLLEGLPVLLVGTEVLGYFNVRDIVRLERACGGKVSHQLFLNLIRNSAPVELSPCKHENNLTLEWFSNRKCKINSLDIILRDDNPALNVKNIKIDKLNLILYSGASINTCKKLFANITTCCTKSINISGNQDKEVIEQLSIFTKNIEKLRISNSDNYDTWLNSDILSRWKPKEIIINGSVFTASFIIFILQTCSELTSITLFSNTVDDDVVMAIVHHCPKLEKLEMSSLARITIKSLLYLSQHKLPQLKKLEIPYILIANEDIARRCSYALSRIRSLCTINFQQYRQDVDILVPYVTGLSSVHLNDGGGQYIPVLAQHCHRLTSVVVDGEGYHVRDILPLCRANPLKQRLYITVVEVVLLIIY